MTQAAQQSHLRDAYINTGTRGLSFLLVRPHRKIMPLHRAFFTIELRENSVASRLAWLAAYIHGGDVFLSADDPPRGSNMLHPSRRSYSLFQSVSSTRIPVHICPQATSFFFLLLLLLLLTFPWRWPACKLSASGSVPVPIFSFIYPSIDNLTGKKRRRGKNKRIKRGTSFHSRMWKT